MFDPTHTPAITAQDQDADTSLLGLSPEMEGYNLEGTKNSAQLLPNESLFLTDVVTADPLESALLQSYDAAPRLYSDDTNKAVSQSSTVDPLTGVTIHPPDVSTLPGTLPTTPDPLIVDASWQPKGNLSVDRDWQLKGDVTLNVKDFTLADGFVLSGNGDGIRDNLTINADGKVTIGGDIFGGGLRNIKIKAKEIVIEGTALISTRLIQGTDYQNADSTGDSGNLTLISQYLYKEADDLVSRPRDGGILSNPNPSITIHNQAKLFTHVTDNDKENDKEQAGDISLFAIDNTVQTHLVTFPTQPVRSATIDITGSTLQGDDITVMAGGIDSVLFSGAPKLVQSLVLDSLISGAVSKLLNTVLPASVEVRNSSADINLTGSNLSGSGNVFINAKATADGSVQAIRGSYAHGSGDGAGLKAAKATTHLAVGVGYATTNAQANLVGTTINADASVFITAHTETTANVKARLLGNLRFLNHGDDKNEYGAAAAVAITKTTSKVLVDEKSAITADGNVTIDANGNVSSNANATTKIYIDAPIAVGISFNHDTADIQTIINGDITAKGALSDASVKSLDKINYLLKKYDLNLQKGDSFKVKDFFTSKSIDLTKVNSAKDTVSFAEKHSFSNGDKVTYRNTGDGETLGGLTDEEELVVRVLDDNTIQLARSGGIDIGTEGLNTGAEHSLSRQQEVALTPANPVIAGPVDVANDTIQLVRHGLATGDEVVYRQGTTAIGGLDDNTRHSVVVIDDNTLQLALSIEAATAGDIVDLTSVGTGNQTIATFKDINRVINAENEMLTIANHGLVTGQEVTYQADSKTGEIEGLRNGYQYFAIVVDKNTLKLAANLDDVAQGKAIDLIGAEGGIDHAFEFFEQESVTTTFEASRQRLGQSNTLTLNNHGLYHGQLVTYDSVGGDDLSGLQSGQQYFVILTDANSFQLAKTTQDVKSGDAIALSHPNNASSHRLIFSRNASRFDPTKAIDGEKNTVTLKNHGLQTGEMVVYNVDATYAKKIVVPVNRLINPAADVDVAANTIALAAKNLKTGDKVIYQTDYLGGKGESIGGLVANAEYFVIKLGDGRVQLAASAAAAIAGQAIDLTSAGFGLRHVLASLSEESVRIGDRAIANLSEGETYYITVLNKDTFLLSESQEEAEAAQAIDLNTTTALKDGHTLEKKGQKKGISIAAQLSAKDTASSTGATGSTPGLGDAISNTDVAAGFVANPILLNPLAAGAYFKAKENSGKNAGKDSGKNAGSPLKDLESKSKSGISGGIGVGVNIVKHTVLAEVGSGAELKTDENLAVNSNISQKLQTKVKAQTGKGDGDLTAGVAIGIGEYKNSARTVVNSGAQLDARDELSVTSAIKYPWIFDTKAFSKASADSLNDRVKGGGQIATWLKDALLGGGLLLDKVSNTYVATKNTGGTDKKNNRTKSTYGLNGSIAYAGYDNISEAIVRSGTQINQDEAYRSNKQSVSVKANTDMVLTGIVGIAHLSTSPITLAKSWSKAKSRNPLKAKGSDLFDVLGNRAGSGIGASVFVQQLNNTTTAKIEKAATIHTGTQGKGLTIQSLENLIAINVAHSGTNSDESGLSGTGLAFDYSSNTLAQLASGVIVTGGLLRVHADSNAIRVNLGSSMIKAGGIGIALSVAADVSDRTVKAIIGNEKTSFAGPAANSATYIQATDIDVEANVRGVAASIALAVNRTAASPQDDNTSNSPSNSPATNGPTASANQSKGGFMGLVEKVTQAPDAFSLGITGGVAGNVATETAQAYIYDSGKIKTDKPSGSKIAIDSSNQVLNLALSAVLSISTATEQKDKKDSSTLKANEKSSISLSAGVSFNKVDHITESFIEGATYEAKDVVLSADKDRNQGSRSVALTFTPAISYNKSDKSTANVNLAGSVAFNLINSKTNSFIKQVRKGKGDVSVLANDDSGYYAATGTLALGLSTGKGSGGGTLGLSFSMNQIDSEVTSLVEKSTLETMALSSRPNQIQATTGFDSMAIAVAGSVAGAASSGSPTSSGASSGLGISLSAAGAGAWNNIKNNKTAAIVKDSKISQSDRSSSLAISANDNSKLLAISGALSLSFVLNKDTPIAVSVGASGAANTVDNNAVLAHLDGASIRGPQVSLMATSTAEMDAYAVVGSGSLAGSGATSKGKLSGAFAGAGAGTANLVRNGKIEAVIMNNAIITTDVVTLEALDETKFKSYAIGLAVAVSAAQGSKGNSVAAGAGVAIAKNEISNTINANIRKSIVNPWKTAQVAVRLDAVSNPTIESVNVAGAASAGISQGKLGAGLAVGVSVAHTTLANTVSATIEDSATINRGGYVALVARLGDDTSRNTPTLKTVGGAVALAAAWGKKAGVAFAAAASVADNKLKNTVRTAIDNAKVTAQDVSLRSVLKPTIEAENFGIAGSASGGGKAGISLAGAGIGSYNLLENTVVAAIQNGAAVTTTQDSVRLIAQDASTIKANGGAGALAASGGGKAGASVAVGIAIAKNTLRNNIHSTIDSATVTAHRNIELLADSVARIEALNVGAALAASGGGTGALSLAAAGVGAQNLLENTVVASIQKGSQAIAENGEVKVIAKEDSDIKSQSYVASISAAGGGKGAGAASVGVAKADNMLKSQVKAFVGKESTASVPSADQTLIESKVLTVNASSDSKIDAKVVSASVALAFSVSPKSPIAIGVAGSGIIAKNTTENTVSAAIQSGSSLHVADIVNVQAKDNSEIDALYVLGNGGLGVGAGVAIAVAITENELNNKVKAYIDNALWQQAITPAVSVKAQESAQISTDNRFASIGAGIVGLAGAGAKSETTINTETTAYVSGDHHMWLNGLTIEADSDTDSKVKVHGGSGSVGLVAAAAGASLATVTDNSIATAYLAAQHVDSLKGDVVIRSAATPKAVADALFVAVAASNTGIALAGAGTKATATINPTVTAYIAEETSLLAKSLVVQAKQDKPVDGSDSVAAIASTGAAAGGGGFNTSVSIDLTFADAYANGTVKAYVGDRAAVYSATDISIEAINNTQQFAGKKGVASGGVAIGHTAGISGGALFTNTHSNKVTEATIGKEVILLAANDLSIKATGENEAKVQGLTFGAAVSWFGLSGRAGVAKTNSTSITRATLTDTTSGIGRIGAKHFSLDANYTNTFDKDLAVISVATTASAAAALAEHNINSTVEATIGQNLDIHAYAISVGALNTSQKLNPDKISLRSASGALWLSLAVLDSKTDINHNTAVHVKDSAKLTQVGVGPTEALSLRAKNVVDVAEKVKAQSYGLIAVGGLGRAEIEVDTQSAIDIDNATLDAQGDINLNSHSYNRVRSLSEMETGGLASGGRVAAKTKVTPIDTITVNGNSKIFSYGEVTFTAGISGTDFSGNVGSDIREQSIVDATTSVTHFAFIPIPDPKSSVETIYNQTHTITLNAGTLIASAKDTNLVAYQGRGIVEEHGNASTLYGTTKQFDNGASRTSNIGVRIDGTVRSHRIQEKILTIEQAGAHRLSIKRSARVDGNMVDIDTKSKGFWDVLGQQSPVAGNRESIGYHYKNTTLNKLTQTQASDLQHRLNRATSEAEKSALKAELAFLNAHTGNNANALIHLVEVENTDLSLGHISITGDYLSGIGNLDAIANNKIKIQNNSDASIRIKDIKVSPTGGEIFFNYTALDNPGGQSALNALINRANQQNKVGQHQASFATLATLTTTGRPEVDIQSTSNRSTVIQLNGEIENLLGTVRTNNNAGDTLVKGNVRAHTVDMSTGRSLIQSYIGGMRHLGGDPSSLWWKTARKSAEDQRQVDLGSDRTHAQIEGENVFIAGEYVNINGTVQAGRANHSALIDTRSLETTIRRFNREYIQNQGKYLFDLTAADHDMTTIAASDKLVRLRWNARDQQIEVYNTNVEGGKLEIHGNLFSTGNGKLKVLDGYSQIKIENKTDYNLALTSLNNTRLAGHIKLTDTSRTNSFGGFHVTEIERLGNTIQKTVNGVVSQTSGRNTTYTPKANQVYRFTTSQNFYKEQDKTHVWRGVNFGGNFFGRSTQINGKGKNKPYTEDRGAARVSATGVVKKATSGQLVSDRQSPTYQFKLLKEKTAVGTRESPRSGPNVNPWGTRAEWYFTEFETYTQHHQHSIKADNAIAIEFTGYDQGMVDVRSHHVLANVILDGTLNNAGGVTTIHSKNKIKSTQSRGSVRSNNVTLKAINGIDNISIEATKTGGDVTAITARGDIKVAYNNGIVQSAEFNTDSGDVDFVSQYSIEAGSFGGDRINLASTNGSIKASVDTGNSNHSVLTALAQGDINIIEVEGHLRVEDVTSKEGDITLSVDLGDLRDGRTSDVEHQSIVKKLATFASADAIEGQIRAIETAKQADYQKYWELRNQGKGDFAPITPDALPPEPPVPSLRNAGFQQPIDLGQPIDSVGQPTLNDWVEPLILPSLDFSFSYSSDQRTQLIAVGKTTADIRKLEYDLTQWTISKHIELGKPTTYDATYTYRIPSLEKANITNTLSQTTHTLQSQLSLLQNAQAFEYFFSLLNENSGLATEEANATGRNITLTTRQGNIGEQTAKALTISRSQLLRLLTPEQKAALADAEAQGIIKRNGDTLTIEPKEDFDLSATGSVSAVTPYETTESSVYLGSTQSVTIDEIKAGGEVQIRSSGDILDGNGDDNNILYRTNALILPKDRSNQLEKAIAAPKDIFNPAKTALAGSFTHGQGWSSQDRYPRLLADINGDGRADIVGFAHGDVGTALGQSDGTFKPGKASAGEFSVSAGWSSQQRTPRHLADVDGDGKADIVGFKGNKIYVARSLGNGQFSEAIQTDKAYDQDTYKLYPYVIDDFNQAIAREDYSRNAHQVADLNGDGLADIIIFGDKFVHTAFGQRNGTFTKFEASYTSGVGVTPYFTASQGWQAQDSTPRYLVDISGDGRADIVGFGSSGLQISFRDGRVFFDKITSAQNIFSAASGWTSQDSFTRTLADVNGDGTPDIVGFGEAATYVAYGNAKGEFSDVVKGTDDFSVAAGWTSQNSFSRHLADVNGDGKADIVGFSAGKVIVALS